MRYTLSHKPDQSQHNNKVEQTSAMWQTVLCSYDLLEFYFYKINTVISIKRAVRIVSMHKRVKIACGQVTVSNLLDAFPESMKLIHIISTRIPLVISKMNFQCLNSQLSYRIRVLSPYFYGFICFTCYQTQTSSIKRTRKYACFRFERTWLYGGFKRLKFISGFPIPERHCAIITFITEKNRTSIIIKFLTQTSHQKAHSAMP